MGLSTLPFQPFMIFGFVYLYFQVYSYLLRSLPALKKGRDEARYIESSPCDEPDRQTLGIRRTPLSVA